MWWMDFVRKVQQRLNASRFLRLCRELSLIRKMMMRRTIRGAQAGFRRFTQFQMWLIKWAEELKRAGLLVPSDLSSSSTKKSTNNNTSSSTNGEKEQRKETDGLLQGLNGPVVGSGVDDDLDVISLDALANYWDHHYSHRSKTTTSTTTNVNNNPNHIRQHPRHPRHSRHSRHSSTRSSRNFDEDGEISSCESCSSSVPGSPASSASFSSFSSNSPSSSSSSSASIPMMKRQTSNEVKESPLRNHHHHTNDNNNSADDSHHCKQMDKPLSSLPRQHSHSHSHRRRHRRPHHRRQHSQSEYAEEQTSHRSAFLDFLFEDSPSPSRFLTTQALQNILGCPSCSEQTMSILPSDISSSSRGVSCRPCEQCLSHPGEKSGHGHGHGHGVSSGSCLLCECSYKETKSLLLEKLMHSRVPCRYQAYGCKSMVGIGAEEHSEENCRFSPVHCPFMLCRHKFSKEFLLINHLRLEHKLNTHTGAKSCETEGTIFCLGNSRRLRGARANYTMDPCALYCYGNMFVLRILRHGSSWYIWVWTLKDSREGAKEAMEKQQQQQQQPHGLQEEDGDNNNTANFPFTIRFRRHHQSPSPTQQPTTLLMKGVTVSVRYSMEEIMDQGLCSIMPEQGSLFDCSEENDSSLMVDFKLVIQPPPHRLNQHSNANAMAKSNNGGFKSEPTAISTRYRKKSH